MIMLWGHKINTVNYTSGRLALHQSIRLELHVTLIQIYSILPQKQIGLPPMVINNVSKKNIYFIIIVYA